MYWDQPTKIPFKIPNIDISQKINSIQTAIISESSEKKLKILAEDVSYGLKIILK